MTKTKQSWIYIHWGIEDGLNTFQNGNNGQRKQWNSNFPKLQKVLSNGSSRRIWGLEFDQRLTASDGKGLDKKSKQMGKKVLWWFLIKLKKATTNTQGNSGADKQTQKNGIYRDRYRDLLWTAQKPRSDLRPSLYNFKIKFSETKAREIFGSFVDKPSGKVSQIVWQGISKVVKVWYTRLE